MCEYVCRNIGKEDSSEEKQCVSLSLFGSKSITPVLKWKESKPRVKFPG